VLRNILILRLKQAQRILKSVGLLYGLLVFVILGLIIYKLIYNHDKSSHLTACILIFISVVSIHFTRNDKRFIYEILGNKANKLFMAEYSLVILPFSTLLLFGDFPLFFVLLHLAILPICFIENTTSINGAKGLLLFNFIPEQLYEWRAGLRQTQWAVLALYILAFVLGFKYYASFIILGLITFIFSSFYNESEPTNILLLEDQTAQSFIKTKVAKHFKFYIFIIAPIVCFYFIKYPEYWKFYLPLLLIYCLNFIVFILNKYKSYIPNQLNSSNTVITALLFLGMFLPYLFPISLILVFKYYFQSINNLKLYFNADNQ
jgi:hypothetical protein